MICSVDLLSNLVIGFLSPNEADRVQRKLKPPVGPTEVTIFFRDMARSLMVTEWRIHVGAHKTATTHLQLTLEAALPGIDTLGGNFVPMPVVRGSSQGRHTLDGAAARPTLCRLSDQYSFTGEPNACCRASQITHVCAGRWLSPRKTSWVRRSASSTERSTHIPRRWTSLPSLPASRPSTFLTVRSLDGYLPSAYAEALKGVPLTRSDFHRAVEQFGASSLHWTSLIARLCRIAPRARFEVWNFDDYTANWRDLHRSLLGVPLTEFPAVPPPSRTRTPGEAAILLAEAEETPRGPMRAQRIREIYVRDIEEGRSAKFDPLSAGEKADFRKLYAEDLAALRGRFPGVLRTFNGH